MMKRKYLLSIIVALCFMAVLWNFASVAWIHGKAYAATFLIQDAWQKTLVNKTVNKPWSWADTWPVAEITIPGVDLNEIVLSGDSGATLAFGPGLSDAGSALGSDKVKLISAHRDTHFRKLKEITIGDDVYVKTPDGRKSYTVSAVKIVDSRSYTIDTANEKYDLVLATCYPFNTIVSGGYKRFVVQAEYISRSQ